MNNRIKILHNSKIDQKRWDRVIDNSPNQRIYANSWFLDIVQPDWNGLVFGNYEYVMPLIYSKKWGVEYAYQPIFAQQHGIFPPPTPEILKQFLDFLRRRFRYIDISLNSMNIVKSEDFIIDPRNNYILSLKPDYGKLHDLFSTACTRNIKKAFSLNDISYQLTLEEFMKFYSRNVKVKLKTEVIKNLKLIISNSISNNRGNIYGAYSGKNELTAAVFFLKGKDRWIYLSPVSSEEGRKNLSMYFLVDQFIKDKASTQMMLDFEGSNIEGIARFFSGFGSKPETYQHLKYNKLPWIIKMLKK